MFKRKLNLILLWFLSSTIDVSSLSSVQFVRESKYIGQSLLNSRKIHHFSLTSGVVLIKPVGLQVTGPTGSGNVQLNLNPTSINVTSAPSGNAPSAPSVSAAANGGGQSAPPSMPPVADGNDQSQHKHDLDRERDKDKTGSGPPSGNSVPSLTNATGSSPPQAGNGLPSAQGGNQLPPTQGGSALPSSQGGNVASTSTVQQNGSGLPSVQGASGFPPPQGGNGVPPFQAGNGLPQQPSGIGFPPPQAGNGLPPSQMNGFPPPQGGNGFPPPQGGNGFPMPQSGIEFPQPQGGIAYPSSSGANGFPVPQGGTGFPTPQVDGGFPPPQNINGLPPPRIPQLPADLPRSSGKNEKPPSIDVGSGMSPSSGGTGGSRIPQTSIGNGIPPSYAGPLGSNTLPAGVNVIPSAPNANGISQPGGLGMQPSYNGNGLPLAEGNGFPTLPQGVGFPPPPGGFGYPSPPEGFGYPPPTEPKSSPPFTGGNDVSSPSVIVPRSITTGIGVSSLQSNEFALSFSPVAQFQNSIQSGSGSAYIPTFPPLSNSITPPPIQTGNSFPVLPPSGTFPIPSNGGTFPPLQTVFSTILPAFPPISNSSTPSIQIGNTFPALPPSGPIQIPSNGGTFPPVQAGFSTTPSSFPSLITAPSSSGNAFPLPPGSSTFPTLTNGGGVPISANTTFSLPPGIMLPQPQPNSGFFPPPSSSSGNIITFPSPNPLYPMETSPGGAAPIQFPNPPNANLYPSAVGMVPSGSSNIAIYVPPSGRGPSPLTGTGGGGGVVPINPSLQQTCVCVPIGNCPPSTGNPNGGMGNIDIRIVTNTGPPVAPPFTCQPPILTQCCQNAPYQCGIRFPPVFNAPIPGPGQAPYGSYPWQAALLGPGSAYVGSGALLTASYVLTAAHRVTFYVDTPALLIVRLGEWNASGEVEPIKPQEYGVNSIIVNPYFNIENLKNDVALLRLASPVLLGVTPTIATVCLPPTGFNFNGASCWVSGWGQNAFAGGAYQAVQKQVNVPVLPTGVCQAELASTRLGPAFQFDPNSFLCAGGMAGSDACTGDGGAPLVCPMGNQWFVAGLVAWGIGCGQGNVPGVYVNVASYVPWIQSIINL